VDAVKRVGEVVGQRICGVDGAGAGAERYYRASIGDGWRVRISFDDSPCLPKSLRQALIPASCSRLGHQVAVASSGTQISWYAPSAGSADEAAQVAREVLARHDISAPGRTNCWSSREQMWLYADEMSGDVAAERQAAHEYRQAQERQRSRRAGFPGWQVRVEVPSHRDVVALAGHLAAQGWGPPAPQEPHRRGGLRRRR
jgi:hypothetical protein